jgi:nicotinate-nucleotide adenylyltransferase
MGSDSYQNIDKWNNFKTIIDNYDIYVYKRKDHEIRRMVGKEPIILNAPLIEVSASQIRENIKTGKSIRYLVPETVREEIETRKLYRQKN